MSEREKTSAGQVGSRATEQAGRGSGTHANKVLFALLALLVAACVAIVVLQQGGTGAASLVAVIHDGDGGTTELPLSKNAEQAITTSLGTNVVVVQDGAVFVREADCDNLDCVHQGKLTAPGKQIICLPHKLWIEVLAAGENGGSMNPGAAAGGDSAGYDAVAR